MLMRKRIKSFITSRIKKIRLRYINSFHAFDCDDFERGLIGLGVHEGDCLLVHSSYNSFAGFRGQPSQILEILQRIVGEAGTVMMPTLPFSGLAVEYVSKKPVFDLVRTPSRMGMLTEMFRRLPDCERSLHPTHPVAARGALATMVTGDHHLASTPCGSPSPFARLLDVDGKILLLGAGIEALTFFHFVEESLESRMPFSPFTQEVFRLRARNRSGEEVEVATRLFDPLVSRRRKLGILEKALRGHGALKECRIGRLRVILLRAREVHEVAGELADQGTFCYDYGKSN